MDPTVLAQLQRNPQLLAERRHELGLDQPVPVRYVIWLASAVQGDLGYSIQSHRPISEEIAKRIPPTLALMIVAILIAILVGIPLGILSALRPYSKADYGMTTLTLGLSSVPTFVLGLGAIYIFAVWLNVLPSGGMQTLGKPGSIVDFGTHLLLPALVLGLASAAPLLRYTRASMLEALNGEYVVAAKAKGLDPEHGRRPPCVQELADPDHHRHRPAAPRARGRRRHHRADLRLARHGPARGPGRQRSRSGAHDGRRADHRHGRAGHATSSWTSPTPAPIPGSTLAAQADAPAIPVVAAEHFSPRRAALRRFMRHRLAVIGIVILSMIVLLAVFADLVSSKPFFTDVHAVSQPPSAQHLLGTDRSGRDVWARVVYGARTSLVVGLGAVAIYVVIGTVLGGLAGLRGGRTDFLIMRAVDTLMSIPTLLLVIVFVAAVGPSLFSVAGGHRPARLAGRVPARPRPDAGPARVGIHHGRPGRRREHERDPVPAPAPEHHELAGRPGDVRGRQRDHPRGGLSFLGLGVKVPVPSWGEMINAAQSPTVLIDTPWLWIAPGVAIALTVLSVNFIGDGLRDALDPRAVRRR